MSARALQLRLSGQGVTLQNGTIEMRPGCAWCVNTDKSILKDTSIKGVLLASSVLLASFAKTSCYPGFRMIDCRYE